LLQHGLPVFLKKKTLDVLRIPTAPIKNVSFYKPVDIMISAGMVDIVMEDIHDKGAFPKSRTILQVDVLMIKPIFQHVPSSRFKV
jgi:hypothetical protein